VTSTRKERFRIKAVTFDLWETLLFDKDGADLERKTIRCNQLCQVLRKSGWNISVKQVETALGQTNSSLMKIWDQNLDVPHVEMIRIFLKHASQGKVTLRNPSLNSVSRAYISVLHDVPPYVNPDAVETLQWLEKENMRVGIICNTGLTPGTELRKLLTNERIAQHFKIMLFSNEIGIRKPDKKIFDLAAQMLNVRPQEMIHIGDNLKTDVYGAKNAGYHAIHLSSTQGRDHTAEADAQSLVSLSRNLGTLTAQETQPDKSIQSLLELKKTIREIEAGTKLAK